MVPGCRVTTAARPWASRAVNARVVQSYQRSRSSRTASWTNCRQSSTNCSSHVTCGNHASHSAPWPALPSLQAPADRGEAPRHNQPGEPQQQGRIQDDDDGQHGFCRPRKPATGPQNGQTKDRCDPKQQGHDEPRIIPQRRAGRRALRIGFVHHLSPWKKTPHGSPHHRHDGRRSVKSTTFCLRSGSATTISKHQRSTSIYRAPESLPPPSISSPPTRPRPSARIKRNHTMSPQSSRIKRQARERTNPHRQPEDRAP